MQSRLTVTLSDQERKALRVVAELEMRTLNDQARYILRCELERRRLLLPIDQSGQQQKQAQEVAR